MMQMQEEKTAPVAEKPEPSAFRLISTLGIAGFLSGAALVGAYMYTLPLIQAARARAMEAAIYEVLPGCVRFETYALQGGKLVRQESSAGENRVFAGFNEAGEPVGYAIQSQVIGFQDVVAGLFGYLPESRTIVGLKILESKETPGLGDKIFKDEAFTANFQKLQVEPEILLVKKGEKQNPNEVDAITGATISSRAVVNLLNLGVNEWKDVLETTAKKE